MMIEQNVQNLNLEINWVYITLYTILGVVYVVRQIRLIYPFIDNFLANLFPAINNTTIQDHSWILLELRVHTRDLRNSIWNIQELLDDNRWESRDDIQEIYVRLVELTRETEILYQRFEAYQSRLSGLSTGLDYTEDLSDLVDSGRIANELIGRLRRFLLANNIFEDHAYNFDVFQ